MNDLSDYGAGSIIVNDNIFKNTDSIRSGVNYTDYVIFCWGSKASNVQIKNNSVDNAECRQAIFVGAGNQRIGGPNFQPGILDISGNAFNQVSGALATDNNNAIILCLVGQSISINNNKMINCIANGTGAAAIKVFPYAGLADIKTLDIGGNTIEGNSFDCGVLASGIGNLTTLHDNTFRGVYDRLYFDLSSAMRWVAKNNTTDTIAISGIAAYNITSNLPDYISKGCGSVRYNVQVAGSPVTIKTLSVEIAESFLPAGTATFYIDIICTGPNVLTQLQFRYTAYAGNNEITHITSAGITELPYEGWLLVSNPDIDTLKPTLAWTGTGTLKTLEITLPLAFFNYDINLRFSATGLLPYKIPST